MEETTEEGVDLTRMECKSGYSTAPIELLFGVDLTRMECKLCTACVV